MGSGVNRLNVLFYNGLCFTVPLDIKEFGQTHRRSLVEKEGNTAVLECKLPWSIPLALPRYRIRGIWLEESTGTTQYSKTLRIQL